ncbi:MAG: nickel pincer cofactor biosynthesis protein LarB [Eubacteriales bacterium]
MNFQLHQILEQVAKGTMSPQEAELQLKLQPFSDLGFAKPDHHRKLRQGAAEVIYGAGKTADQIIQILQSLRSQTDRPILVSRLSSKSAEIIQKTLDITYYDAPKLGIYGEIGAPDGNGTVVVITAGTSDIPVAEEAALTAEVHGSKVVRLYDVGVSGLHRLLSHVETIMTAQVIIAVAGMEGALPSVVGGLADCPVIAVPTSVGYGASLGGVAALLSMLNSCASGVSVVNIDNGFGAGYLANMMNHMGGAT